MDRPYTRCKPCNTLINYAPVPPTAQGLYHAYRRRVQGQGEPDMLHPFRAHGHLEHEEVARLRPDPEFQNWTPPNPNSLSQPSVAIMPPLSFEASTEFIVRWVGIMLCWIFAFFLSAMKWCGRQIKRCLWDNEKGRQITRVALVLSFLAVL